ncbi:MAG: carboxymuconolactone decarboxylase family protein [Pseudomonadota bacterium]
MTTITVPTRDDVSPANQALFDNLQSKIGFVPNLYATLAHSENALGTYLTLQSAKSSINAKAREVVNLVVSQVNDCEYCLAAHTAIGKMNGFSDDEILEIRSGRARFDAKFDVLARLTQSIAINRGKPEPELVDAFLAAGFTQENLVDVIVTIGDKIITNYLHSTTRVPVDWEAAPALDTPVAA